MNAGLWFGIVIYTIIYFVLGELLDKETFQANILWIGGLSGFVAFILGYKFYMAIFKKANNKSKKE